MSEEMGLQPLWSPTTEAPINLQKHMRIYIWPRVNVRIVSLIVRGEAREGLFRIQGGYLLAFAAVEQHILPCASRHEENIIATAKCASTYSGSRLKGKCVVYSVSIIHKSQVKTFL